MAEWTVKQLAEKGNQEAAWGAWMQWSGGLVETRISGPNRWRLEVERFIESSACASASLSLEEYGFDCVAGGSGPGQN
jgi:hypothetical protein